jgi:hypothetical protein
MDHAESVAKPIPAVPPALLEALRNYIDARANNPEIPFPGAWSLVIEANKEGDWKSAWIDALQRKRVSDANKRRGE